MATQIAQVGLKLVSNRKELRAALFPLAVGIGMGWVCVLLWLGVAYMAYQHSLLWGFLLLLSLSTFALLLGFLTYSTISDACRDYEFEIRDNEAFLMIRDRLRHRSITQMVLLSDVKYAEYYPYQDSASIILHSPYVRMEVPLWPMGSSGQDVVDFLIGRGIRVVNVQSDDLIPD